MFTFTCMFVQTGTYFDDGGNFDKNYNTLHNDYQVMDHRLVMIAAQLRNSFGDPQPPTYDYWAARLKAGDTVVS